MSRVDVIAALASVARPELRRTMRPDSCVASTRAVIAVLKTFGIPAEPRRVKLRILNPVYARLIEAHGNPRTAEEAMDWRDRLGAHEVAFGYEPEGAVAEEGKMLGHLIAWVPSRKLLVDASLDQADRPQRGIVLPPVLVRKAPLDFGFGRTPVVYKHEGIVLYYEVTPGHRDSYEGSVDWSGRTVEHAQLVARLVEQTRAALRTAEFHSTG